MNQYLLNFANQSNKIIDNFKKEITLLKTGRVTPAQIENILIECYGQRLPLIQLASINAPDPRTLLIQPWDKNIIKEIEKTLSQSDLNAVPTITENNIRLSFSSLTEEIRQETVKLLNKKLETSRIEIRKLRETIRETIIKADRVGEISEDDKFKLLTELDEQTKKKNDQLKEISEKKIKEILTI